MHNAIEIGKQMAKLYPMPDVSAVLPSWHRQLSTFALGGDVAKAIKLVTRPPLVTVRAWTPRVIGGGRSD